MAERSPASRNRHKSAPETALWRLPLLLGVILLCACSGPRSALHPAGPAAEEIARMWWLMLAGSVLIWLLVMALFWRAMRRRTSQPESDPQAGGPREPDGHGEGQERQAQASARRLIIGCGLVMPTVVLLALLVYGTLGSSRITAVGQPVDHTIEVVARQFSWEFRYLDEAGAVRASSFGGLLMPQDALVEFLVQSEDVVHSFWIPRLGGKVDAIPGRVNRLRLRADHDGDGTPIAGQCAELCGFGHAFMHFPVRVVSPAQFEQQLQLAAGGVLLAEDIGEGGAAMPLDTDRHGEVTGPEIVS